ncbi:MAG: VCBS repeat-containing protein [bacterium]|nr:VCBS repeat-containing protein [bacterium]
MRIALALFVPLPVLVSGVSALPQFGAQVEFGGGPLRDLQPFDIDLDGDLDLIGIQTGSLADVVTVENLGNGTFGTPLQRTNLNVSFPTMELVDMDGDGVLDVLTSDTNAIFWMQGFGGALFGPPQAVGSLGTLRGVTAGDYDNDGDMDVAAISGSTDRAVWFCNNGMMVFGPGTNVVTGILNPTRIRSADLDADGVDDIVLASFSDDRISWVRSLGAGAFDTVRTVTSAADQARDVIVADLDGDGRLDLLSASSGDNKVAWYRNLGGVQFGSQVVLDTGATQAYSVATGDLDGDGDLDVVGGATNSIRWIENLGGAFFGVPQPLTGTTAGVALSVVAFDGDADSDADIFASTPGVFLNQRTLGNGYCTSVPNSTGVNAVLAVSGSDLVNLNAVTLVTTQLPPSVFGFYITSLTPGVVNQPGGSQGVLCMVGAIGRYNQPGQLQFSGVGGRFQLTLDLETVPTPTGSTSVNAGQTWHFQAWYRDAIPAQTSNFSDAVEVMFL